MDVQRKPLSERHLELIRMPSIASQMPVRFANGAVWSEMTGHCKSCGRLLPAEFFCGAVTRPMESVAVIEAVGACTHCKLLTQFDYRLHDDMTVTGQSDRGWARWDFRRPRGLLSRPSRLIRVLRQAFYRLGETLLVLLSIVGRMVTGARDDGSQDSKR